MGEIVSRLLFALVFALLLVPMMCVVTAPYILFRSFFGSNGYWRKVRSAFRKVIQGTLDFGTTFLQP